MEIQDLTPQEDLVFIGLLKEVIQADGDYSEEEKAAVAELEEKMGSDRFLTAMERAKAFASRAELKDHAKKIERVGAQKVILNFLIHVAAVDGVDGSEEKPLKWLTSWWPEAML